MAATGIVPEWEWDQGEPSLTVGPYLLYVNGDDDGLWYGFVEDDRLGDDNIVWETDEGDGEGDNILYLMKHMVQEVLPTLPGISLEAEGDHWAWTLS